jgi:hypothetical protein
MGTITETANEELNNKTIPIYNLKGDTLAV